MRSRTADILITSEVLYQLSYGGSSNFFVYLLSKPLSIPFLCNPPARRLTQPTRFRSDFS